MQPRIIQKDRLTLLGLSFYGDPFVVSGDWDVENEIGRVWQRFMNYFQENHAEIAAIVKDEAFYEVHVYGAETERKGFFEVFVGMEPSAPEAAPLDLLLKTIPAATYAVFTLNGEQITSDWHKELGTILTRMGIQRSFPFIIQLYDARFKGMDKIDESEIDVYIPVKPLS
jgi:AraC family transcriptional regulator